MAYGMARCGTVARGTVFGILSHHGQQRLAAFREERVEHLGTSGLSGPSRACEAVAQRHSRRSPRARGHATPQSSAAWLRGWPHRSAATIIDTPHTDVSCPARTWPGTRRVPRQHHRRTFGPPHSTPASGEAMVDQRTGQRLACAVYIMIVRGAAREGGRKGRLGLHGAHARRPCRKCRCR